jgi:hypothetical protein
MTLIIPYQKYLFKHHLSHLINKMIKSLEYSQLLDLYCDH